jgi:hypothetical protein
MNFFEIKYEELLWFSKWGLNLLILHYFKFGLSNLSNNGIVQTLSCMMSDSSI